MYQQWNLSSRFSVMILLYEKDYFLLKRLCCRSIWSAQLWNDFWDALIWWLNVSVGLTWKDLQLVHWILYGHLGKTLVVLGKTFISLNLLYSSHFFTSYHPEHFLSKRFSDSQIEPKHYTLSQALQQEFHETSIYLYFLRVYSSLYFLTVQGYHSPFEDFFRSGSRHQLSPCDSSLAGDGHLSLESETLSADRWQLCVWFVLAAGDWF